MKKKWLIGIVGLCLLIAVAYGAYRSEVVVSTKGPLSKQDLIHLMACVMRTESDWLRERHEAQIKGWGNAYCLQQFKTRGTLLQKSLIWNLILGNRKRAAEWLFREPKPVLPGSDVFLRMVRLRREFLQRSLVGLLIDAPSKYAITFGQKNTIFRLLRSIEPDLKETWKMIAKKPHLYRSFLIEHAMWFAQSQGIKPVAALLFGMSKDCFRGKSVPRATQCKAMLLHLQQLMGVGNWEPNAIKSEQGKFQVYISPSARSIQRVFRKRTQLQASFQRVEHNSKARLSLRVFSATKDAKGKFDGHLLITSKPFGDKAQHHLWKRLLARFRGGSYKAGGWIVLSLSSKSYFQCSKKVWFAPAPAWVVEANKRSGFLDASEFSSCERERMMPYLTAVRHREKKFVKVMENMPSRILTLHPSFSTMLKGTRARHIALLGPLPPGSYELSKGKGGDAKLHESFAPGGKKVVVASGTTTLLSFGE